LRISAIIPAWNEAETIERAVISASEVADEVIVVDGGSLDETAERARASGARVAVTDKGRGQQLDTGARIARGDVLLFLHADARLPTPARDAIGCALGDPAVVGGNFRVRFIPRGFWSTVFSRIDDLRRRRLSIYYGDSAPFVRRRDYEALGGFRAMPIMEDYDFLRRLERHGRTAYLRDVEVEVSARRFATAPLRSMAVWALIQILYSSGVPASRLSRLYADIR
jgi:rSAM/selenodomain-associated transferase 2